MIRLRNLFESGKQIEDILIDGASNETTGIFLSIPATAEMKVKSMQEINLEIELQGNIGEVILYGSPLVYWARSKVDWEMNVTGVGTVTDSTTYKEKNNLGGFAGLRLPLGKGLSIEVEGQLKNRFSAGGSLAHSF